MMEEDILKIIKKHCQLSSKNVQKDAAKEIADHYRKFEEWKDWQMNLRNIKHYFKHNKYRLITEPELGEMTLDELYNYYKENVLKK